MANQLPIPTTTGVKQLPPSVLQRQRMLAPLVVIMLLVAGFMQSRIDPDRKQFSPNNQQANNAMGGLNNEFLLLPLLGFREAAAGLLWVRCDEFFHSGDYDAILPLVRVITWLDPKSDNVYITGAWHLAYNFTDSSERSDRRYITPAQSLLTEGINNNMEIPDIKFEKGWQNYDKIKDFPTAEAAFKLAAATKPNPKSDDDEIRTYGAQLKVLHILAHTYEKEGRIPEALDEWRQAIKRSDAMLAKNKNDFSTKMLNAAEKHNEAETLQRYYDRYTAVKHSKVNDTHYPAIIKPPIGSTKTGPWDVALQDQPGTNSMVIVESAKKLRIKGLFNAADGARIDVRLDDWDYQPHIINSSTAFAVDPDQTIMQDSIAVRKNGFEREIDMSKDPKMYSFSHPYYRLVLSYNPRTTSPHLLDRFGWNGEGITDSNPAHLYVDRRSELLGTKYVDGADGTGPNWDGQTVPWMEFTQPPRTIRVVYKISRDQILGLKPITDQDIQPN